MSQTRVQPHDDVGAAKRLLKVTPLTERSSLLQLLTTPLGSAVIVPKRYFQASNELVVITLVVCWVVTLCYDADRVWNHPARRFTGHMNPCFGWDYAPASYIAVFACGADVYLAWTYAMLEATRTHLRNHDHTIDWAERFSLVTTYLHGTASMLWMALWLVGPPDGRWEAHLAIFAAAAGLRYLCTLGNYVECRFGRAWELGHVKRKHTVFIALYGFVTMALPVLYFYDVLVYQAQGRVGVDPPLPWWLLEVADCTWMLCLAVSTKLSVPEPPIIVTRRVLEFDEEFDPEELALTPEQLRLMRRLGYTEITQGM